MSNNNSLLKKSYVTLKSQGPKEFYIKAKGYIKNRVRGSKLILNKCYKDVLFVNGCSLPHPPRFRIDHQIEQLHFNGYSCDAIYYEQLSLELVKYYRCVVFFRCPTTPTIEKFIEQCKYFNKKVFFDIDDLVIDYEYVKNIKHLDTMSKEDYDLYMDGVNRTKRVLELCDAAITTTSALARELKKYVPIVYTNRNVASEHMVELSLKALQHKKTKPEQDRVVLGYFSGSITHNADFDLILPIVKTMLRKYNFCYLKIAGILDVPSELAEFGDRIITEKFRDWRHLPEMISEVDINLAPLEMNIFNEAKSENKWIEAALVKVPTIASNVGSFAEMIEDGKTGILCDNTEEWSAKLDELISNKAHRERIANTAHQYVIKKCVTAYTGYGLASFLEENLNDNIAFVLPSTQISGGVNVVIKHCNILRDAGKDVTIISMADDPKNIINNDGEINVVVYNQTAFHGYFNKCVATLWTTVSFLNSYPKIKHKFYLVQNFETNFYEPGHVSRVGANLTYNSFSPLKYITISKWCEDWLKTDFRKEASYARNGIDTSLFEFSKRNYEGKIRVLVEGNSEDYYKNVDESFRITNKLDRSKYEVWYMSYSAGPKDWYKIDKFLNKVPHHQVAEVYKQCHILVKSSILESFSYPPLEMMATGGIAVVCPNEGNMEYLRDKENCMLYEQGNIEEALNKIIEISQDEKLRASIVDCGLETAKEREWAFIKEEVIKLYNA